MDALLYPIFGVMVGGVAVWGLLRRGKEMDSRIRRAYRQAGGNDNERSGNGREKGLIEKQAEEKRRNKEAIVGILKTQTPLTNNHVEMLLGISDATATRYLDELEKEGKVRQVGKTGSGVYYERI